MKLTLTTLVMILFVSLLAVSPSWSEGTSMDDLVVRDGLSYKKFTDVPFTGEIDEGREQGGFKNGNKEGPWVSYWDNGQLQAKGSFKNGKQEGPWVSYLYNGQCLEEGDYKNGKKEGTWLELLAEGNFKNYKQECPGVSPFIGHLMSKFDYKNGKKISD